MKLCTKCGAQLHDDDNYCTKCGVKNPDENQIGNQCKTPVDVSNSLDEKQVQVNTQEFAPALNSKKLKKLKNISIIIAVIFFVVSLIFFIKGYDVKNNYHNSDYSFLSENAYVGGDAYNYIINGTYFTSYSIIASATLICGAIFINRSISLTVKLQEVSYDAKR